MENIGLSSDEKNLDGIHVGFSDITGNSLSLAVPMCKFKIGGDEGDILEWRNLKLLNEGIDELVSDFNFEGVYDKLGRLVGLKEYPKPIQIYNSQNDEIYLLEYGCFEGGELTYVESETNTMISSRYDSNPYIYGRRRARVTVTKHDDKFSKPFETHRDVEYLIGLQNNLDTYKKSYIADDNLNSINEKDDDEYFTVDVYSFKPVDAFDPTSPMYDYKPTYKDGERIETWFERLKPKEKPQWVIDYNKDALNV